MTKEEVLQKVNDYCSEKSYTTETLTDEFKDKFADFFAKKYSTETAIDAEGVIDDLKFNINTAFSATSKGITAKTRAFESKESDYQRQIEELKKKVTPTPPPDEIPEDVRQQLNELQEFRNKARKQEKFEEVVNLAKKNVREDLHASFLKYAAEFVVNVDESSEEQARKLTERFQDIVRETIGNIKPLAPNVSKKRDEEFLAQLPKVKI